MKLSQRQQTKQIQTLKQILSPKMIHMLKLFNSSYHDLAEHIVTESKENVMIEIEQHDQLADYEMRQRKTQSSVMETNDIADFAKDDNDKNLHDFLKSQLNLINITTDKKQIAEFIIDHINDTGYIDSFKSLREQICKKFNVKDRTVVDILKVIHTLEPEGVGARSLKECLLIQLDHLELENDELFSLLTAIIKNHIDDLGQQNYSLIAAKLQLEESAVMAIHEFIKSNFNPKPGQQYSHQRIDQFILPSFEVYLDATGTVKINHLEKTYGIKIKISDRYLTMLKDPNLDEETKTFLTEKLKTAKELEENLANRGSTLERLSNYIFEKQIAFVKHGFDFLLPLLQKQVAEDLQLSPSTVSRLFSSKFCRTPHGIFALKQLCPRNHFGKTSTQLKKIISQLITENPSYSDQKISQLLHTQGIPMKRRTVTKYRQECQIKSSFNRNKT
ncbi:RNA polymerase sigma-54 factor [Candidatus Marinamargulisbacteria bacterium SCGC AG-414-C22]|nr:RNA polymerase sigma-54 factor [Candidatus Marinamargulisbacteria bacterium SCGC AG-414-C22]